jgi:hypothetical protein
MEKLLHNLTVTGGWGLVSFPSSGRGLVVFSDSTFSPFNLKVSHETHQQMLAQQSQGYPRDCSGPAQCARTGTTGGAWARVTTEEIRRLSHHHSSPQEPRSLRGVESTLVGSTQISSLIPAYRYIYSTRPCSFHCPHVENAMGDFMITSM